MAKLYFSYAAMNAGKSAILLQAAHNYREQGMQPALFTSALYGKDGAGEISSRIGIQAEAELYHPYTDLFTRLQERMGASRVHAVFIDEAQFLSKAQVWQLARAADHLGMPVLCYGLRTDFRGELFEGSGALLALADSVREIRTICACGRKATMVARLDETGRAILEGEQVSIGKDVYVSLCRRHWEEKMGRFP